MPPEPSFFAPAHCDERTERIARSAEAAIGDVGHFPNLILCSPFLRAFEFHFQRGG
jgi:hypothetical protein